MRNLTKTLMITVLFTLTTACGEDNSTPEEEEDPEEIAEEAVEEALEDYDRDNELESLREQIEAQDGDLEPSGAYLWTVDNIEREIMFCEDTYYHDVDRGFEDVERFCMCRTEMLSVRWSYEDYQHHPFSYVDHLEMSNRLDRCTEPSKFSQLDEPEEIEEDQEFSVE